MSEPQWGPPACRRCVFVMPYKEWDVYVCQDGRPKIVIVNDGFEGVWSKLAIVDRKTLQRECRPFVENETVTKLYWATLAIRGQDADR